MIGHNASEGIEPRNFHRCIGPKVSCPGSQQRGKRYGERVRVVPGSKSVAGHLTVYSGTWESHAAPSGSLQQADERQGGGMAVWQSDQLILEV